MGMYARARTDEAGKQTFGGGDLFLTVDAGYNKNPVDPFDIEEDTDVRPRGVSAKKAKQGVKEMVGVLSGFLVKDYRIFHMLIHHIINLGVSPLAQCRLFRAGRYKGIRLANDNREFRADGYRVYTRIRD